jgi:hypothetical protein
MQLFQQGLLFTNDQKGPVHLRILLHYWDKQRAYWGKCPSSYIVKKCPERREPTLTKVKFVLNIDFIIPLKPDGLCVYETTKQDSI